MHPRLLPSPAVHLRGVSSRHTRDEAVLGGPLLGRRGRGAKRTRPQLPALRPAGPRGEGGPRARHKGVRGWHGGQEPPPDLGPDSQHGGPRTPGVLKLRLGPGRYGWVVFLVAGRKFTVSGEGRCHVLFLLGGGDYREPT